MQRKAAEAGDAEAMYKLGLCYKEGKGVKKNGSEAANWFLKS
ncbi:MAG: sel1 repeat family protein, partial [Kiritimatiellae bacterium]|nr:sel1 repeat family protein [Kiritimatiellia bacterium]